MTGFIPCKHWIDKRDDLEMTFQFNSIFTVDLMKEAKVEHF